MDSQDKRPVSGLQRSRSGTLLLSRVEWGVGEEPASVEPDAVGVAEASQQEAVLLSLRVGVEPVEPEAVGVARARRAAVFAAISEQAVQAVLLSPRVEVGVREEPV